jgi:hypothetical protein
MGGIYFVKRFVSKAGKVLCIAYMVNMFARLDVKNLPIRMRMLAANV